MAYEIDPQTPLAWASLDATTDAAGAATFALGQLGIGRRKVAWILLTKETTPADGRAPVVAWAYDNQIQTRFGPAVPDVAALPLGEAQPWGVTFDTARNLNLFMTGAEATLNYRLAIAFIIDPIHQCA